MGVIRRKMLNSSSCKLKHYSASYTNLYQCVWQDIWHIHALVPIQNQNYSDTSKKKTTKLFRSDQHTPHVTSVLSNRFSGDQDLVAANLRWEHIALLKSWHLPRNPTAGSARGSKRWWGEARNQVHTVTKLSIGFKPPLKHSRLGAVKLVYPGYYSFTRQGKGSLLNRE